jgi:hypothetical protein
MLKIGTILKSFSQYSHAKPALTAFTNYLVHECDSSEHLTATLLQNFIQESLVYPHWWQNRKELRQEVQEFVAALCRAHREEFDLKEVTWPDQMQLIEIEQVQDWSDAVNSYLSYQHRGGDKFRLIHDELLGKMIAVILNPKGGLTLRMFDRKFFIRDGALVPLRENLAVHFDQNLELAVRAPQKVETAAFITSKFFCENNRLFGNTVRGYFFQKIQEFTNDSAEAHAKIFYTLRRLESHFLKRENDPFYQNMTADLEHGVKMIRLGDDQFVSSAPDLLSRAQNAIDYVFPNDKLLSLLLRDLQYTMVGQVPKAPTASTTAVKQAGKEIEVWNERLIELTQKAPLKKYDLTN